MAGPGPVGPPPGGRVVLVAIGLVFLVGVAVGFLLGRTV
jgi:hypothetical protein